MLITKPIIIAIALGVLLLAGCAGRGGTSLPEPTSTGIPEPAVTASAQTGIAAVDTFLDLVAAKDLDTIATETAFQQTACETEKVMDGPLLACRDTEADGTHVETIIKGCFPFSAIRKNDLRQRIEWLADATLTIEAVFEVDGDDAAYAVAFTTKGTAPAPAYTRTFAYLTDDGRLSGYDTCGEFTDLRYDGLQVWP